MSEIPGHYGKIVLTLRIFCKNCGGRITVDNVGIEYKVSNFIAYIRQYGWRRNSGTKNWFCPSCVKLRAHTN